MVLEIEQVIIHTKVTVVHPHMHCMHIINPICAMQAAR